MNKKFDVGIDLFKEFLLELGFRYIDNEKNSMYSDEYGDMWIYFSYEKETDISKSYTFLDYSKRDVVNIVDFIKFLNERKESAMNHDYYIEQAGIDW